MEKQKILLLQPSIIQKKRNFPIWLGKGFQASPPLGLMYIAAVLKNDNYELDVFDFNLV